MGAIIHTYCLLLCLVALVHFRGSEAIHCFVCHSVNGSNADCEGSWSEGDTRAGVVQRNCHSLDGTADKRTPMRAYACLTILGEYEDPRTGEHLHVLTRDCSAVVPNWSTAKNIRCSKTNIEGYVRWDANSARNDRLYRDGIRAVDGCMEVCSEDYCNGQDLRRVRRRFRDPYTQYYHDQQRTTATRLRYPPIFNIRDEEERGVTTGVPPEKIYIRIVEAPLPSSTANRMSVVGSLVLLSGVVAVGLG